MSKNRLEFKSDVIQFLQESSDRVDLPRKALIALYAEQAGSIGFLKHDIRAFPKNGSPATFSPRDPEHPEPEIQSALNYAANEGGGRVEITEDLFPYDESQITGEETVDLTRVGGDSVREVPTLNALRELSTHDAASAHVRTPSHQSGLFLPMEEDPFGNGDDGATVVQGSNENWWVRQEALADSVQATWFGLGAELEGDDTKALRRALDFAEGGTLVLPRNGTVTLTDTIEIPPDTTLVPNGAELFVADDVHGLIWNPGATTQGPLLVDTTNVEEYTSAAVVLSPSLSSTGRNYKVVDRTQATFRIKGRAGEGTGLFLHTDPKSRETHYITWVELDVNVDGFQNCVHVQSNDRTDGWINSNILRGSLRNAGTLLYLGPTGQVLANQFRFEFQPIPGTTDHWALVEGGRNNLIQGTFWDPGKLEGEGLLFRQNASRNTVRAFRTFGHFVDKSRTQDNAVLKQIGNRLELIHPNDPTDVKEGDSEFGERRISGFVASGGVFQLLAYGTRALDIDASGAMNGRGNLVENARLRSVKGSYSGGDTPDVPTEGELFFDTDTQRPLWWDAAEEQWIYADGTAR
jgi:hypothetical protein